MRPVKESESLRLNFYMKKELVQAIDEYADFLGLTRSGAISVLCANQLQAVNAMKDFGKVSNSVDVMAQYLNKG